ncbi:MAG TPA: WD40 repeat domain-containing protein, partial [Polyangia bacterium]
MTMLVALPPRLRLRARVPIEPAGRMAWTRSGDRVIVATAEATSIVASAGGGEPNAITERWPYSYTAFACGWDDSYVAAANARGFVDLWRFGRPRPGEPTARHGGRITAIAFSDDDRRIFTAGDDGRVGIWRAATLEAAFHAVGGRAHDLAYDRGDDALGVAAGRSGVVLLDGTSGERRGGVRPPDRAT